MKSNKLFLSGLFFVLMFSSCANRNIYFKYYTVTPSGWNKDSLYTFDVNIPDTSVKYNVYINVRNRGEYPYQNLWLFIDKMSPDSVESKDTINFYLADQRGKWLGSGAGSIFEMPVLYQQQIKFKKAGTYKFSISQGMRTDVLPGINNIGMRVEKAGR